MTKDEFYGQIDGFGDLIDFCVENGCEHIVTDVRSTDDFDEWVWDCLDTARSSRYWYEIKRLFDNLCEPYSDYFLEVDLLEYRNLDDDSLEDFMADVVEWGDNHYFWDEDEDDDESSVFEENDGFFNVEDSSEPEFVVASFAELTSLYSQA